MFTISFNKSIIVHIKGEKNDVSFGHCFQKKYKTCDVTKSWPVINQASTGGGGAVIQVRMYHAEGVTFSD